MALPHAGAFARQPPRGAAAGTRSFHLLARACQRLVPKDDHDAPP
jgi:hypothetical protein